MSLMRPCVACALSADVSNFLTSDEPSTLTHPWIGASSGPSGMHSHGVDRYPRCWFVAIASSLAWCWTQISQTAFITPLSMHCNGNLHTTPPLPIESQCNLPHPTAFGILTSSSTHIDCWLPSSTLGRSTFTNISWTVCSFAPFSYPLFSASLFLHNPCNWTNTALPFGVHNGSGYTPFPITT